MKSQKTQIVVQTLVPFSVTFGIICLLLSGNSVDDLITKWEKVLALGFLALGIALLQDLIPKSVKEFLVFWRRRERAAGHRAFSKARRYSSIIDREEVVDIEIRESLTPKHQDRLFYIIYDKYRDKGNISHYSFRYLQWRELASISILSGIVGYIFVSFNRGMLDIHSIFAMGIGAAFYVASVFAARNSANLLVDYVLLAETIEKNGGADGLSR